VSWKTKSWKIEKLKLTRYGIIAQSASPSINEPLQHLHVGLLCNVLHWTLKVDWDCYILYYEKFGKLFENNATNFAPNSLSLPRSRKKTEKISFSYDVTDLKVKTVKPYTDLVYAISYSYTDFDMKLNGFMKMLAWMWLSTKPDRFWFGVNMIIEVITEWNIFDIAISR